MHKIPITSYLKSHSWSTGTEFVHFEKEYLVYLKCWSRLRIIPSPLILPKEKVLRKHRPLYCLKKGSEVFTHCPEYLVFLTLLEALTNCRSRYHSLQSARISRLWNLRLEQHKVPIPS